MANLHFTNNTDVCAATVRARKFRSVVETAQHSFPAGLKTPVISFDEDILLSKNRNNPTRQHMKTNPIKSQQPVDLDTGPAAIIRNLAFQGEVYHVVVTDRFYTSVQRVYQLLSRIVYSIGTMMGDTVGYPQEIVGNKS
ncbi:hypothetical protein PHMEG_00033603 [Phytophthora megakarya]|uniref:PiggyBac transposable element-derived protein domain-containing protein n=1 Tax=Phytophthora megakarya TaxID=4795 RepID=A0A225UT82_9STRA|nr:hypothetical protein PHMEG_00033603 [Phytophthora megakarya]